MGRLLVSEKGRFLASFAIFHLYPWAKRNFWTKLLTKAIIQQAAGEALSSAQVAARFQRTKADKVKPLLDTLAMMAQVRYLEPQGTYAA